MTLAGILSAGVTLYGVYSANVIDFRQDTILTGLYCLLPFLSFPAFLLVRPAQRSAAMLAVLAVGYVGVFSALNWRTCAELGYCGSVASTVLETLKTRTVLAYFCVAAFRFAAEIVDDQKTGRRVSPNLSRKAH
jgi:hypothetical protein